MPRKLTDIVQVNLRMRESLRRSLEKAAADANNSLNAEMVERLDKSFQNEDLRPLLHALHAKQARQGRVIIGFISDEFRKRGLDEPTAKELVDVIGAYLGVPEAGKETTEQRIKGLRRVR